jgi:hypothetical protein
VVVTADGAINLIPVTIAPAGIIHPVECVAAALDTVKLPYAVLLIPNSFLAIFKSSYLF